MRILSIDPGFERLGIAIIERPSGPGAKDILLYSDCFKTSAKLAFSERLVLIGTEINRIITEYAPTILAIETLFFTNNQKTAMNVSEARGVVMYEAARNGLEILEYTPLQIKMATTGYGKSDKGQIIFMIPKLIRIQKAIQHDDEYDAIAAGITCLAMYGKVSRK